MADNFYQNVNFHFSVNFTLSGATTVDVRFQSVTGLDSTIDTETIREGGENRFEHVIPTRRRYGPLILKRGLLGPSQSGLTAWLKQTFDDEQYQTLPTVSIYLLGEEHAPILHWTINNVWPRSWKIGDLNAERGEVLLETLELNYNRLIFDEND
ncbi:MAG TPA: phage tail protein [Puia sp.]|nr:phage tail protein [Puia sp.]